MIRGYLITSNFRSPAERKIESFQSLPAGWHYGSGGPLGAGVVEQALVLNSYLHQLGLTHTDAFAGRDGDLQLTAYHQEHYLAITVHPDGLFTVNHEEGDNERFYQDEITSLEEVKKLTRGITGKIWSTLGFSILKTLTSSEDNSLTLSSKTQAMVGCQSLKWAAFTPPTTQFVSTASNSIPA